MIGPRGILATKARLLVTNAVHFLQDAHSIVVLRNGRIVESGTFEELRDGSGHLMELLEENETSGREKEREEEEGSWGEGKANCQFKKSMLCAHFFHIRR